MSKEGRIPSCWEIMGCENPTACLVRMMAESGGQNCWEVVRKLDDYRSAMNVCSDCIVYVLNQQADVLSNDEIQDILARKGKNVTCPASQKSVS